MLIAVVLCGTSTLPAQEKPTPATSLERLKAGNDRFAADKASTRDVGAKRRMEVAKGNTLRHHSDLCRLAAFAGVDF